MSRNPLSTALGLAFTIALAGCTSESTTAGPEITLPADAASEPRSAAEPPAAASAGFRARGNEPGWLLEIGNMEMVLLTNFGQDRLAVPTPDAEIAGDTTRYVARTDAGDIAVTITGRTCVDSMSGMPHPQTVEVVTPERTLSGCGGEPVSLLLGTGWSIAGIDGAALAAGSQPMLTFSPDGSLSGQAPCNRFSGSYSLTGESLTLAPGATTRMACDEAVMAAEREFLAALAGVQGFAIAPDGALLLRAGDGRTIEARRP
jgi:heat shock protein HslJ/uncharacterized membrane protein